MPKSLLPKVVICPEARLTEWTSAGVLLWWTYLLCLPVNLFHSNLSFLGMEHRAGEGVWVWGTGGAAGLLLLGQWQGRPILRSFALAVSVAVFQFIGACIAQTSPHFGLVPINTGFGNYSVLALADFAAMILLSPCAMADTIKSGEKASEKWKAWEKRKAREK